jgi:hypothetical protein
VIECARGSTDELGTEYFEKRDAERVQRHHVTRLKQLGYDVTLTPLAASRHSSGIYEGRTWVGSCQHTADRQEVASIDSPNFRWGLPLLRIEPPTQRLVYATASPDGSGCSGHAFLRCVR